MTASLTVAAIQTALTDDVDTNVDRVEALVREAAAAGGQVIAVPELFEGHYFCVAQREVEFERARPVDGHPTIERMRDLARELDVVIPVSFFEKSGPEYFNSVAMVDAGGEVLGVYRKSHIPDGPGYQEKFYFRPGDTGFRAWTTRFGTIGVGICWDQWFPEAARAMTLLGADVLLYPTAIGSEPEAPGVDTKDRWQRAMIGHAVSNVVTVVASNRIGSEGDLTFYGHSFIADYRGELLAELDRTQSGSIVATIDLDHLRRERAGWGFFRDRRPDLYKKLTDS